MALMIACLTNLTASTLPFEEDTVVVKPQASSEDPFQIETTIPAVVKEVEEINEEIKKLSEDDEEKAEAPEEASESPKKIVKHKVQSGDSLWAIAQRLLGDGNRYRELIEANKDKYPSLEKNPDLILTGWELDVPVDEATAAEEPAASEEGEDEESVPAVEVDDDSGSSAPEVNKLPNWSIKEKIANLQSAVDSANRKLLSQNKRIAALNSQTIRFLIDNGFMTEEEWMAMNPPAGYTYRLDRLGKVELVDSKNEPLTNEDIAKLDSKQAKASEEAKKSEDKKTDKKQEKKQDKEKDKKQDKKDETAKDKDKKLNNVKEKEEEQEKKSSDKKEDKAKEDKAKEDKAKEEQEAKKAAETRYGKMLAEIGVPDVSDNKNYYKAMSNGSKFLSKGLFGGTTPFFKFVNSMDYPNYNIKDLQNQLKTLQNKYEKQVREGKTDKLLGFIGSNIESTGKQIAQVKEKLAKAWKELKKALDASKEKANELNSEIKQEKAKIATLKKELDKMDIYDSANAKQVQAKMKAIKTSEESIKDAEDKLDNYKELTKVFKI
jgi:hypothetical protein